MRAAINGVIREGVIAAVLTALMILLFLGSARSTLIVATSIPLAVLFSIIFLGATGNTLNIMTLGGLALAVGILVDEGTVTIESITYHLEMGKGVVQAILDGSAQIVTPAFVSLLCICIVFVPMFFLPGVAGYLFVPLALAVIFAMIGSFILSRTLVPTMAMYLLKPHDEAHAEHRKHSRNPFTRFQQGFEKRFERVRAGYGGLLQKALDARGIFSLGFLVCVALSFLLVPFLGRNFFPTVDAGRSRCTSARRSARASRTAPRTSTGSSAASARSSPAASWRRSSTISACRSAASTPSTTTAARSARRTATSRSRSARGIIRSPATSSRCASSCRTISRLELRLPARRHHQPDPELRRAGPDRHADHRQGRQGQSGLCAEDPAPDEGDPGIADARIQQSLPTPSSRSTSIAAGSTSSG